MWQKPQKRTWGFGSPGGTRRDKAKGFAEFDVFKVPETKHNKQRQHGHERTQSGDKRSTREEKGMRVNIKPGMDQVKGEKGKDTHGSLVHESGKARRTGGLWQGAKKEKS